jgi:ABC-type uncharacterized transport system ATPase subunit
VADRVTVMRRGEEVGTKPVSETNIAELARMMVGREVLFDVERKPAKPGEVVLEVRDLLVAGAGGVPAIRSVSFDVHEGEIFGIAGVNGNGQTELAEAITGMRRTEGGSIHLHGVDVTHAHVDRRRAAGVAHIPEDRMRIGLNLNATVDENLIVSRYRNPMINRFGFLRWANIRQFTRDVIRDFDVAAAQAGKGIATLSGGNLQKIVLGRELTGDPSLIVANQPTRGLDVGSIEFVYRTLLEARDRGAAILLISVELDEIMSLSDRIAVLFRGRFAGEMGSSQVSEDKLGILMAGGSLSDLDPAVSS